MKSYLIFSFLLHCLLQTCFGQILFSKLPRTLVVNASPQEKQVLNAGEDGVLVSWGWNQSFQAAGTDYSYESLKLKLCFAPLSQVDRAWRKTVDNLSKDKTCQFTIYKTTYDASLRIRNQTFEWRIEKDVPTATYFVRAYAYNSAGEEVAYGQTTDSKKTSNLFAIEAISGSHAYLDIASASFSAFAIVSLIGFFFIEKRKNKKDSSTI